MHALLRAAAGKGSENLNSVESVVMQHRQAPWREPAIVLGVGFSYGVAKHHPKSKARVQRRPKLILAAVKARKLKFPVGT